MLPSYLSDFDNCSGELGTLKKEYHIVTDPNVTPVTHACRKVPDALRDRLHKELTCMEKLGIIIPVTKPTDWVSSMVMIERPNGSLPGGRTPYESLDAMYEQKYAGKGS